MIIHIRYFSQCCTISLNSSHIFLINVTMKIMEKKNLKNKTKTVKANQHFRFVSAYIVALNFYCNWSIRLLFMSYCSLYTFRVP